MNTAALSRLALMSATAFALALISATPARAETVATAPVGVVTKSISVGFNPTGISLCNTPIVSGTCSANSQSTVSLSGISNLGTLLTAGEPYYLEVIDGSLEGDRFDISTADTISSNGSTVILNIGSTNNTYNLTGAELVGCKIVLRKHITLEQIATLFSPSLIGNNNPSLADQVLLYTNSSNTFIGYYLRGDNITWRQVGATAPVGKTVFIPPGVGFFIQRRSTPTKLAMTGVVRTNDFSFPLPVGNSYRAPAYPIPYSPASLGGTATNGWTGNNNPALADQIQTYDAANNTFIGFQLRGDGSTWRQVGTTSIVTNSNLIDVDGAFFTVRKLADSNYILTRPFSLN